MALIFSYEYILFFDINQRKCVWYFETSLFKGFNVKWGKGFRIFLNKKIKKIPDQFVEVEIKEKTTI